MARDLVVFGEDWGGLPSSTQHIISHLVSQRRVFWVNSIGLRRPRLGLHDVKRVWNKISRKAVSTTKKKVSDLNTPAAVVSPLTLPAPKHNWERRLSSALLERQLKPLLENYGIKDPILWTSLPTAVDVSGKLGDRNLVYYCGDDFSALAGVDHQTVSQREFELVERADLVIAASDSLVKKHSGGNTKLLTHGVSFDLFSSPAKRALDLPCNGKPTAGFYGSISEWLNIELLEKIIAARSNWNFVFIGKAVVDISRLTSFKNVYFLGERNHKELPRYSQHWNVSLLPFHDNEQIRACNPLKLREYLATGTPVISTSFPAVNDYSSHIQVANTDSEFLACLDNCVKMKRSSSQASLVAEHDWGQRANQVSEWLDAL